MRKHKNKYCIGLTFVLGLLMSGCALSQSIQSSDDIIIDVYSEQADYMGLQPGWFADVVMDKFGVKLNYISSEESDFMLYMSREHLADLVILNNLDNYRQAAKNNALFDWEDEDLMLNYGQYINDNLQPALTRCKGLSENGKLYGVSSNVASDQGQYSTISYHPDLRYDLYEQLDYPTINTLEDYIPVLKSMKELCPTTDSGKETYGVSLFADWDDELVMFVAETAGLYGYETMGPGLYNVNDGSWHSVIEDDSMYIRCLKFYNELYRNDLLDPDSMTQSYNNALEKYQDGRTLFSLFSFLGSDIYNTKIHIQSGQAMLPVVAADFEPLCYEESIYGNDCIWAIGAQATYPEICMEIINWLYTPEGKLTYEYGPQGVTWDYGEDGNAYLTEFGLQCISDTSTLMPESNSSYKDGFAKLNNSTWSIMAINPETNGQSYQIRPIQSMDADPLMLLWQQQTGYQDMNDYMFHHNASLVKSSQYSMSEQSTELDLTCIQVSLSIKEFSWKAIYATTEDEFYSIVDMMTQKLQELHYNDCIEFYTKEAELRKKS